MFYHGLSARANDESGSPTTARLAYTAIIHNRT